MIKKNNDGAITIFYCITLMVLITFCLTIVDITRMKVAMVQGERALKLANDSILAGYDAQLYEQYGIFARSAAAEEIIKNNLEYYMEGSLQPENTVIDTGFLMQYLYPETENFHLYQYDFSVDHISNIHSLVNPQYVKLQILEFMKYRAPFLAVSPFLSKLEGFQKASKTTEILAKKNKVISKIGGVKEQILLLENYIDGINIEIRTGDLQYSKDGRAKTAELFIKQLYVLDGGGMPVYKSNDFPDNGLVESLNQRVWFIDQDLNGYKNTCKGMENCLTSIFSEFQKKTSKGKKINNLKEDLKLLRHPKLGEEGYKEKLEEYKNKKSEIKEYIDRLEKEIKVIDENIETILIQYEEHRKIIYKYHSKFRKLVKGDASNYSENNIQSLIERSLLAIDKITYLTNDLKTDFAELKKLAENKEGEYIDDTCENIYQELEKYEKVLGFNDSGESETLNNIRAMKKNLIHNRCILEDIRGDVVLMWSSLDDLENDLVISHFEKLDMEEKEEFLKEKIFSIEENREKKKMYEMTMNRLDNIETKLDGYTREFYFDYSNMKSFQSDGFSFSEFIQKKKGELDLDFGIFEAAGMVIYDNHLPSKTVGNIKAHGGDGINFGVESYTEKEEVDKSTNTLNQLKDMGDMLVNLGSRLRNSLYINEYVIGMFNSATDQHILEVNGNKSLTMNGYEKDKHFLDYEVEYVLFGNEADIQNLAASLGIIYGIRVALNMIHIVSSGDKMNRINTFANAIAGWWTLGIGGLVIAVVIILVWAMLESVVDIKNLLKGEKVPLLKTALNWETDIFSGIAKELGQEIVEEIGEELAGGAVDEDGSIQLSYNDYLRLLLLTGIVDEETKIYRIMDLIQLNIVTERNESILLENYLIGFDSQATVKVNLLFLNGSWLDSELKDTANKFKFEIKQEVSY